MEYKEWSETAVSEFTCEFGKDGIREVYKLPCGITIYDEVIMPRSIFKPQYNQTLVDVLMHRSQESYLKENYNAELDYNRYSEEDYGYPLFKGEDSCERAYNFAMKYENN
jgi:hypothetical protein